MKRFWPVLFLFLLPVIPLWRCVFLGEAIGPFDQIRQMAPWNGPAPTQPWDVLQADGVLQFYPWREMVLKSWASGHVPLWNPYELAGTPLLANSQSAALYPPHIVLGVLHVPTAPAMTILAWLHLFWAGLGTYLLARRLGASKEGALVAGASFELSAFLLTWTGLPSVITTVSWIPWVLAGALTLFESATLKRAVLLSAAIGMMILSGHLQFVAYGFMALVLLAIGTAGAAKRAKPLLPISLAMIAGVMLAAPQLLPVLQYGQFSHRRGTATEDGYTAYTAGAIKPFELGNLFTPYALGSPREPVDIGGQKISAYWPAVAKQGANLAESAVTIGPFVLGLLFLVPWRDRRLWPIAGIGLLALLLALGTILNKPLYFLIPGWSSTGSPGRIIALFVLACCVLAGVAFGNKSSEKDNTRAIALVVLVAVLGVLLNLLGGAGASSAPEQLREAVEAIRSSSSSSGQLMIAVAVAAGALVLLMRPSLAKYRPLLVAVPVVLALPFAATIIMTGKPLEPIAAIDSNSRVAILNEPWDLLTAAPATLPPNLPSLSGIHEIGGYDSLLHRDTKSLLDGINGKDAAPPANGNMMFVKPGFDVEKAKEAGVTDVWSRRERPELGQPTSTDGMYRYTLPGSTGRLAFSGTSAKILVDSGSTIRIETEGAGILTFRDRYMPGWTVSVDGRPMSLGSADSEKTSAGSAVWKQIGLPEGSHKVAFDYSPPGMSLGFLFALAALLVMGGAFIAQRRADQKQGQAETPNA